MHGTRSACRRSTARCTSQVDAFSHGRCALMLRYRDGDVHAFEILYAAPQRSAVSLPAAHVPQPRGGQRSVPGGVGQSDREPRPLRGARAVQHVPVSDRAQLCHRLFPALRPRSRAAVQDIASWRSSCRGAAAERPDEAALGGAGAAAFRRALQQLPAEQRDVFVLYEESGLSLEEIGRDHRRGHGNSQEPAALCGRQIARFTAAPAPGVAAANRV